MTTTINIKKYLKTEAVEELIDDHDLIVASLQANIDLKTQKIEQVEKRLTKIKPANHRLFGYTHIQRFKEAQHLSEMKKLTLFHYQDGLRQRLDELNKEK